MIRYIENTKVSNQKLLQLINEFRKIVGKKIYIQKSVVVLYTKNEISGRKKIPFKIASEKNKMPRNKLNQKDERPTL